MIILFDERKHFSNNIQNCYETNSNFYLGQFLIRILRLIERISLKGWFQILIGMMSGQNIEIQNKRHSKDSFKYLGEGVRSTSYNIIWHFVDYVITCYAVITFIRTSQIKVLGSIKNFGKKILVTVISLIIFWSQGTHKRNSWITRFLT